MKYLLTDASISKDGIYRYLLVRQWNTKRRGWCAFIGLNPSTADASQDDPTIRRCVGFADDWGYGTLLMVNLFAFRATQPEVMMACDPVDPIGPENNEYLRDVMRRSGIVIAAWGTDGGYRRRDAAVKALLRPLGKLYHLGLTKDGHPRHPLYLKKDLKPIPWG